MLQRKKFKKLVKHPNLFFTDAINKREALLLLTKKTRKLFRSPTLYTADYINKRPKFKNSLEKISSKVPSSSYHYKLSRIYSGLNYNVKSETSLNQAIQRKQRPEYYFQLGKRLKSKKLWWQAVDAFATAIDLSKQTMPSWYKQYALCLTYTNRFNDASKAWKLALTDESTNSNDWFLYGDALDLSGKTHESEKAFEKAIKLDRKLNSVNLGIGVFHEQRGDWINACEAYKKILSENPTSALLYYKYALSLDRCYNWKDAERAYLSAITLNPENTDWYYRLGFVRERMGEYEKAEEAYNFAATKRHKHTPYWYYRLGYVLFKSKKFKESCDALLMMKKIVVSENSENISNNSHTTDKNNGPSTSHLDQSTQSIANKHNDLTSLVENKETNKIEFLKTILKENTTQESIWYELSNTLRKIGKYKEAANCYKELISRKDDFDGELYFSLGHMHILSGDYKEGCKALLEQRVLGKAHGIAEASYNKDPHLKPLVNYTNYYDEFELDNKTILYESYHGRSISCNPFAIFKYLLAKKSFKDFKHVWVVDTKLNIPKNLKKNVNILFITRGSDGYMRYLAKTKYLINNVSFPEYFIRKEGQIYINTWHGTPIKSLGKDIKDDFFAHKNVTRNFLQASHLIQPNSFTTEILLDRYDIKNTFSGIVAETGYPRQDLMLGIKKSEKKVILRKLNTPKGKKVVLYAPTWRGSHGDASFDTSRLENDLQKIASLSNIHLIFRGHHMIEHLLNDASLEATVVPSEINTNSLLSIVDVLITDYSSIAFDYMALERPIIYYAYDLEEYNKDRGMYTPLEKLGGEICYDINELYKSLEKSINTYSISETQIKSQNRYCSNDDNRATKRVVDLVFFNKAKKTKILRNSTIKSLLLYGGPFIPNGITTSYVNLLNHIDTSKYSISIAIDPSTIKKDAKRLEQFSKIGSGVSVLARSGGMLKTLEEKWISEKFDSQRKLASKELYSIYKKSYSREYKRLFSTAAFDSIINFEGYNLFWTSVFSSKQKTNQTNSIYLHNDMHGEWLLRFPYLEKNFRLFRFYNSLVSVSKMTMKHNRSNLSQSFGLEPGKFGYCDNIQDPQQTLIKSKEALATVTDDNIFIDTKVFINIARLSPEKGQEKLIRAFHSVYNTHPESRLVILGTGPLRNHLLGIIKNLKLDKYVFLLGHKSNPYPYLSKSACFILSSNHEGQPMTLFEALIIGKPIIATDIIGNRSVLEGRSGNLVDNSVAGLRTGMLDFLDKDNDNDKKNMNTTPFDYRSYNKNALNSFYEAAK